MTDPIELAENARGWHGDPNDSTQQRYWDGSTWTRTRPAPAKAAPGWYPDPSSGAQRYWDGSAWGPVAPVEKKGDQDLTFGVLLGIAIPIVGFLYGFWLLIRGNGNGGWVIFASIVASFVWIVALGVIVGLGGGR